jgi:methionine-rich copper-binding protein CopC
MKPRRALWLIAVSCLLTGAGYWHIELTDSRPTEDAVVTASPTEIWLRFDVPPDLEQSGIALLGTSGIVQLDEVALVDSVSISAKITGPMEPGEYIVSWRAAPLDDHGSRGRVKFTLESSRDPQ